MRQCTRCERTLPLDMFALTTTRTGKKVPRSWCRDCYREYDAERAAARTPEQRDATLVAQRERMKRFRQTERGKANHRKYVADYRARHPEKIRAREKASKIPIQGYCERCGKVLASERHHNDHAHALDVELLCFDCHHRGGTRTAE